jgi:hypothetical protein
MAATVAGRLEGKVAVCNGSVMVIDGGTTAVW